MSAEALIVLSLESRNKVAVSDQGNRNILKSEVSGPHSGKVDVVSSPSRSYLR